MSSPQAERQHQEKLPSTTASSTVQSSARTFDAEHGESTDKFSLWNYLNADVDPAETTAPLAAFAFMTGYIDVLSFSAIFVWCGFQTGNFAQLALAIARLWEDGVQTFRLADQQALCSLIAFNLGAVFGRVGDRVGAHKRIWLVAGSFVQALLTMAAAIVFWKSGQEGIANEREHPSWTNTLTFVGLAFISASLGLQGVLGKRLNTAFGTTIVLTTVWVELMTDPKLFNFKHRVLSRDHRLIFASSLFLGAFFGRAILGQIGTAGTLGVAVGFRTLIAFAWVFVPQKAVKKAETTATAT